MPQIAIKKTGQPDLLERFVGGDARIVTNECEIISNYVKAEWMELLLPESSGADDRGMLYLFPINDEEFCLKLYFMQYPEPQATHALVCSLEFLPAFFEQYPPEALMANQPFRFDQTTEQQFPICAQSRTLLSQLRQKNGSNLFIRSLQQGEVAMRLLRCALECITIPFEACQVPACRFLAYDSEREKIQGAVRIIEQSVDQPLTIPELARKVAMNECYLKKGFKTIMGKTIHEYQQELRIEKAKGLLQRQGCTVTDVANILGYSSISHFSTAFKRVTGMKPCELLK